MKKTNFKTIALLFSAFLVGMWSCSAPKSEETSEEVEEVKFLSNVSEIKVGDQQAKVFHLENSNGMVVEISSFGGIVTKLIVPDRDGKLENVVLGYESIDGYDTNDYYLGATAGRYANRIAKGKFELDGKAYQVTTNDGNNHLHGGTLGFNRKHWDGTLEEEDEAIKVKLTYRSPDGEEGYPGNLSTTLVYTLTEDNKLLISFESVTDKPTIVNLTHHGYFNLSAMKEDILSHELTINAAKYTPVDGELIPTGELKEVKDTPFDFNKSTPIGERISDVPGGYDHNYVVKEKHDGKLAKMATLYHAGSGRVMELYADSPAVQFYSGNFLDGALTTNGITYSQYMGLCLEPQTFPNAPNEPSFPSARLNPGEKYVHNIELHFSAK
ncbi:aldose epimerase family protein [Belliella kenyensis]|uniref:Aldose 1-epimerase n=1 Tax=Belliella kenyensis TaxID=1472724 RepID=A0ABV8ENB2_9BACT|nr:aldose epimerase family protein [Belliella kenyensis]MCH7400615.1 galactose mutarotase [Belliella kenyensis]MDN3602098.1 aldose epimerase family protein [Belliella kenyensis]